MNITEVNNDKEANKCLSKFQKDLFNKTKLMCSIGVGPTRFLAKMGSDYKKPMGITIMRKRDIKSKIYPLKVQDFYGIGMRTTPHLRAIGINTIGDLAIYLDKHKKDALALFGKYYYDVKACLDGTSDDKVYLDVEDPKSIGNSMTLMMDTDDEDEILKSIRIMSQEVSARLKAARMKGKTIQLTLKDTDFKVYLKSHTLDKAINDLDDIYQNAVSLYRKYFKRLTIRLVGVTLSNLVPLHEENVQLSLFDDAPEDKINDVINQVNRKFKKTVVGKASTILKDKKHAHK
ncbi:MAG: hypothetical protein MJ213_01525, partial [Bacilli bacterium]|nr:hypothetical protein [Bacilli bacterium]